MKRQHYRDVGPRDLYDLIGAQQFIVLVNTGLRDTHKLLDIGCGSLRGGRLFIPYLNQHNYYGIEPNRELVEAGFENELGWDILVVKVPKIDHNDQCDTSVFGVDFDYALAQSLFTHLPLTMITQCLDSLTSTLVPGGQFLFTFFEGDEDYKGTVPYSHLVRYRFDTLDSLAQRAGFEPLARLPYVHPRQQTWVRAIKPL
jgi:SAM-dependent methyltransferase